MKILLITGPGSEVQGWGNAETTEFIRATLKASGKVVEVLQVLTKDDLLHGLDKIGFDLAWSSIYQISDNTEFIGLDFSSPWVMDLLDEREIPYVGSSAPVLKTMLDKVKTRDLLAGQGLPVPQQHSVELGEEIPKVEFPAFVKPRFESQSAGVSEDSIVNSEPSLAARVQYIHQHFGQCALVEEFLPGTELTVSMLGENRNRGAQYRAVANIIDPSSYKLHPVIMTDIKGVLTLRSADHLAKSAESIAAAAVAALGCRDHVRVDMREDNADNLKIIEVNGIPGLSPGMSRSCGIHQLFNPLLKENELYDSLITAIVDSALYRAYSPAPMFAAF